MSAIKYNRLRKLCDTARYPRTFQARLAAIPETLLAELTAKQIATIIDGPMQTSHAAGWSSGYDDAK